MFDLFRFMTLRPIQTNPADDAIQISLGNSDFSTQLSSAVEKKAPLKDIRQIAKGFLLSETCNFTKQPLNFEQQYSKILEKVGIELVEIKKLKLPELKTYIEDIFNKKPLNGVVSNKTFPEDKFRLYECVVALKITGNLTNLDVRRILNYIQIIHWIELIAASKKITDLKGYGILKRAIILPPNIFPLPASDEYKTSPAPTFPNVSQQLKQFKLRREGLQIFLNSVTSKNPDILHVSRDEDTRKDSPKRDVSSLVSSRLTIKLKPDFKKILPEIALKAIEPVNYNWEEASVYDIKTTLLREMEVVDSQIIQLTDNLQPTRMRKLGTTWMEETAHEQTSDNLEQDLSILPATHGKVRPVGVADLLVVRKNLTGYEMGEIAYIENIMQGEAAQRNVKRSESFESSTTLSTESIREEERDLQTEERFELAKEVENVISVDGNLKPGQTTSPDYGPFVEFESSEDAPLGGSQNLYIDQAENHAKNITSRAVSRLTQKTFRQEIRRTARQFEQENKHAFDNKSDKHIVGIYQWVDKVYKAKLYNYGRRLFYDLVVPEPAAFYWKALESGLPEFKGIIKPVDFTLQPGDITDTNYLAHAAKYGATQIEPPPPPYQLVPFAISEIGNENSQIRKVVEISLPRNYEAVNFFRMIRNYRRANDNSEVNIWLGDKDVNFAYESLSVLPWAGLSNLILFNSGFNLNRETERIPLLISADQVTYLNLAIEIECERSAALYADWQIRTYSAIRQAYLQRMQEYERVLSAQTFGRGGQWVGTREGRRSIEKTELKKYSISLFTYQQFDVFQAIIEKNNIPEIDLSKAETLGRYVNFFEQVLDWEQMLYTFYPYFWGAKSTWRNKMLLEETDAQFAEFLKAGAARVVIPVRPGFEAALAHYMDTGSLPSNADLSMVASPLYHNCLKEIGNNLQVAANPVLYGKPWELRLPTNLVKVREDGKLPKWKEVDGKWVEDNESSSADF